MLFSFKAAVLVVPVIFYLPKFFEFSWRQDVSEVVIHKRVDCTQVRMIFTIVFHYIP